MLSSLATSNSVGMCVKPSRRSAEIPVVTGPENLETIAVDHEARSDEYLMEHYGDIILDQAL